MVAGGRDHLLTVCTFPSLAAGLNRVWRVQVRPSCVERPRLRQPGQQCVRPVPCVHLLVFCVLQHEHAHACSKARQLCGGWIRGWARRRSHAPVQVSQFPAKHPSCCLQCLANAAAVVARAQGGATASTQACVRPWIARLVGAGVLRQWHAVDSNEGIVVTVRGV